MLIGLLVVYSVLSIPFLIAFNLTGVLVFEFVIDGLFFLDVVVSFNTAYIDSKTELLIVDRRKIAENYFKTFFWVDLLSSIPFDDIVKDSLSSSSFLSVIRLMRLLKIVRLLKLKKMFNYLENLDINQAYVGSQSLIFKILLICHTTACLWVLMANFETNQSHRSYKSSASSNVTYEDTWLVHYAMQDEPIIDQYIASIYWTFTTLFTVGYGDITAVNSKERIFSICVEVLGGVVFGAVIAQVAQIMDKHDPAAKAMADRMSELQAYLDERELPVELKHKAKVNTYVSITYHAFSLLYHVLGRL